MIPWTFLTRLKGGWARAHRPFALDAAGILCYGWAVKIDRYTSQAQLMRVTEAALRRDFLLGTPLNLKAFLRIALLFMLFPGMVLGFRVGMLLTGLCAAFLMGCLFWGQEAWGVWMVRWWFIWGALTVLGVSVMVGLNAWRTWQRRKPFLPADDEAAAEVLRDPQEHELHWQEVEGDHYECRFSLDIPQRGIYAYLLTVDDYEGEGIGIRRPEQASFSHGEGKPSLRYNQLFLYRFEPGLHELAFYTRSLRGGAPQARFSQLNEVA